LKIITGLGNPGARYEGTRHNVGFSVVETLADKCRAKFADRAHRALICEAKVSGSPVILVKPQTYMNLSGVSVAPILKDAGAEHSDLVVVHDDLDLPLGRIRIRKSGGDGGHRGVASIMAELDTGTFVRVRVGIGRPEPGSDPAEYVLMPFLPEEAEAIAEAVDRAVQALIVIVREGPDMAMNRFNKGA